MSAGASWQVYMLRCRNGTLYTGITTDITRRLKAHNAGRGAAYLRRNGPGELVYLEDAPGQSAALKREAALKRLPRRKKLELVAGAANLLQHEVGWCEGATENRVSMSEGEHA